MCYSQGIQYGNSFGSNGRMAGRRLNFQTRHVPNIKARARMKFSVDEPACSPLFQVDMISSKNCCERWENMLKWKFKDTEIFWRRELRGGKL